MRAVAVKAAAAPLKSHPFVVKVILELMVSLDQMLHGHLSQLDDNSMTPGI